MDRPYIICHMTVSSDGKVTGDFLSETESEKAIEKYYEINRKFNADAFACGRVTMEESFTGGFLPDYSNFHDTKVNKEDYIADNASSPYAVSFDRYGNVGWKNGVITDEDPGYDNRHVIEVLLENTPDDRLCYYKNTGVSYIFAGKDTMDIPLALKKLRPLFGIELLLLEGGSIINGAFKKAGVIDELSLVYTPISAKDTDKPLFYDDDMSGFCITEKNVFDGEIYEKYKKRG